MTIDYVRTKKDFVALNDFVQSAAERRQAMRAVFIYGLVLAWAPLVVLAAMFIGGDTPLRSYVMLLPPAAVGAVIWLLVYKKMLSPNVGIKIDDDRPDYGPHRFEVVPQGLRDSGPTGEGMTRWTAVTSIDETPTHLFVKVEPLSYFIVPKSGFDSAEHVASVKARMMELWQAARPTVEQ